MNREVFLSILAMDAYQRGYAFGINDVSGTSIGRATISRQSDMRPGSNDVTAGFYAIAYDMTGVAGFTAGERVISYRGAVGH